MANPGWRIAVVAPTFTDGRDTCIEGESGLLACIPPSFIRDWNRSLGELFLINNSQYKIFTAETPNRLRGPQHHRSWCDEICSWKRAEDTWDMLQFGLRLGRNPQNIITSTPKPVKLIRDLIKDPNTIVVGGSTYDNRANLPPSFFRKIIAKYEGTRLGQQELYAQILDDLPGSLWSRQQIDVCRWRDTSLSDAIGMCVRIVVAIDPSVSNEEDSDETGIVGCGILENNDGVVLADESLRGSPHEWASRAVALYKSLRADCIIAEVNNGGDLVIDAVRMVDPNVPVRKVVATRGKYVRAEPISLLYEQARIHHLGLFELLEDQMCMFVQDEIEKHSPDRADALVWAFTELFSGVSDYGLLNLAKEIAAGKVSITTGVAKVAVSDKMPVCQTCGTNSGVARMGGMFRCNTCTAVFLSCVGDPMVYNRKSQVQK